MEPITLISGEDAEMGMEHLLKCGFAIGQEEIDSLAADPLFRSVEAIC